VGKGRSAERSISRPMTDSTIVAMGGGGFGDNGLETPLDEHILSLARSARGRARPRVCYLPTASGDAAPAIVRFYSAFARRADASHLGLFDRSVLDLEGFLLDQDAVYVGGGNTANMLAIWRVHGLDRILRRAWDDGIVLAGRSAGSICWFEGGTTDSFGGLDALPDGLGFLPGSHSPHYDGEPGRRPTYQRLVASGELPPGYAADDGAALVFRGTELAEVVAELPAARGYRVERGPDGTAVETELATRFLG
jgi:dipeptidase E